MAKFATQTISNMTTGTHTATIVSVSPPRTSRAGNRTCSIQFKNEDGQSAFQYCNVDSTAIAIGSAVNDAGEEEATVSLPDNTDIFCRKMEAAGFPNPINADELVESMQIDDDSTREQCVADVIYAGLKEFMGLKVNIRVKQQHIAGIGVRTSVSDILSEDSGSDEDIEFDTL